MVRMVLVFRLGLVVACASALSRSPGPGAGTATPPKEGALLGLADKTAPPEGGVVAANKKNNVKLLRRREVVAPTEEGLPGGDPGGVATPLRGVAVPAGAKNNVVLLRRGARASGGLAKKAVAVLDPAESDYPRLAAKYWADPRIHSLGNIGLGGVVHALVAPIFTFFLDKFAYAGTRVRLAAMELLDAERAKLGLGSVETAVDLGTGTGSTARAIKERFQGATVSAVDTSRVMLKAARDVTRLARKDVTYVEANAEATPLDAESQDLVTCFFVMHEATAAGRVAILREAARLCKPGGTIAVADIHSAYSPSPMMQAGEPYLTGYLAAFEDEVRAFERRGVFLFTAKRHITQRRLTLWTFHKK